MTAIILRGCAEIESFAITASVFHHGGTAPARLRSSSTERHISASVHLAPEARRRIAGGKRGVAARSHRFRRSYQRSALAGAPDPAPLPGCYEFGSDWHPAVSLRSTAGYSPSRLRRASPYESSRPAMKSEVSRTEDLEAHRDSPGILCDLCASVVNSTCQKLRETWRLV
jgi:hypothetical protein